MIKRTEMETILRFLKEQLEIDASESNQIDYNKQDYDKVNQLFRNSDTKDLSRKHISLRPSFAVNQIWLVKSEYIDFLGNSHKTSHPFIVIINSDKNNIEEEDFVRINVISPFTVFASNDDFVCNDASIIGFPFLIEKWNNQPILTEILGEYLGYFEVNSYDLALGNYTPNVTHEEKMLELEKEPFISNSVSDKPLNSISLNKYQREFRDIEISKAKYLNNSITSLLAFLENSQTQDSGVVISLFDKAEFPKFYIGQNQAESSFALAARTGADKEDKYIKYLNEKLPFDIYVRKNENGFIITIRPFSNVKLFNLSNQEINGVSNKERIVFERLTKGLYRLKSESTHEQIKIRLK